MLNLDHHVAICWQPQYIHKRHSIKIRRHKRGFPAIVAYPDTSGVGVLRTPLVATEFFLVMKEDWVVGFAHVTAYTLYSSVDTGEFKVSWRKVAVYRLPKLRCMETHVSRT